MFSKSTVLATAVLVPLLVSVPAADAVADPVACAMFCEDPAPTVQDCVMFCAEPPAPPADAQGCRLFCDLNKPNGREVG